MEENSHKDLCRFLLQYASTILMAGCTNQRCERVVFRVAEAFNANIEMTILPRTVTIGLLNKYNESIFTISKPIPAMGFDFNRIYLLSKLSWEARDSNISLCEMWQKYHQILDIKRHNNWKVTLLTAFANMSFCRLFEGDIAAMIIVFLGTLIGFWLKNFLHTKRKWDIRFCIMTASFISALIACILADRFEWSETSDTAIATSVLYLVPGIPYINCISDMIHGHMLCSVSRIMHATVTTTCLGIGLCIAIILSGADFF